MRDIPSLADREESERSSMDVRTSLQPAVVAPKQALSIKPFEAMGTDTNSPAHVIALHCSGSGAGEWRKLKEVLGAGYDLAAPEYYGNRAIGPWSGTHAFTLRDEAASTLAIIDAADRMVHLVGHSYGGGVALHVALERPDRIASLTLYEPSAFHLLKQIPCGAEALAEILAIFLKTGAGVITGDYRGAAEAFVDYWSGEGAWSALPPELQHALTQWAPKAPLDFAALIEEQAEASAYARLRFPTLIIRGEHAPTPTRLIAETLAKLLLNARLTVIAGAGHMGPLTHSGEVNALIVQHLAGVGIHRPHPLPHAGGVSRGPSPSTV